MFKKVSELLESNTISKEAAEAIDNEITVALGALRDENKTLRQAKDDLSKNYDEILKSKGDLDTQLAGLDDKIAQAKKDGQTEIAKQLEDEKTSKVDLQKSLEALQKANTGLTLDSAVAKQLDQFDIKKEDRELVGFRLRANVSMDDGKVVYTDGNNTSSIEDGFKGYFESNQSRLNPKGEGDGSGSKGGGGGGNIDTKDMTASQKMEAGRK